MSQPTTTLFYSWRGALIFAALLAKFILCVQPSYIHPDEFYQSFQILYNDNLPWEVSDPTNINRSIFPLLLTHYPSIWIGKTFSLSEFQIYLLVRIQLTIISWIITDFCLYRLVPMKHERIKASLFTMTSYLTLVHQSHTFSNSTETCILLPTIYIINDIRSYLEHSQNSKSPRSYSIPKLILLGILISIGTFNRITFPAWIILPSIYLLKFFLRYPTLSLIPILLFISMSYMIILIDTAYFNSPSYTIAPLNNLLYNSSIENLRNHGIHPRYTHILINYPQIIGPLVFLVFPFTKNYIKTTTFLSIISGFLILSIFPHQELRFLLPSVPLLSTLISFSNPTFSPPLFKKYYKLALSLWLIYTTILSVFYGVFHQAGIVPAINEINTSILYSPEPTNSTAFIFWRTYPPPTWMFNNDAFPDPIYISKQDNGSIPLYTPIDCSHNYVIDLMGSSIDTFNEINDTIHSQCPSNNLYLITPTNAVLNLNDHPYTALWNTFWHLDMDHFEFDLHGWLTFIPGLGLYSI